MPKQIKPLVVDLVLGYASCIACIEYSWIYYEASGLTALNLTVTAAR